MTKFILKLLLFLAMCAILDVVVGYASVSLQRSSVGGITQKDEYIKEKMNAEIVIMGSSRASHHYVSNLLSDSLGYTVYNAGRDGKGIIMHYGLLLEITRRYNPKKIIYELTPAFDWIKGDNERYLLNLRHAYQIVGIDSIFWNVNINERLKMLSKSYQSNSLIMHLIYDNLIAQNDSLNGYIPLWDVIKIKDIRKESIEDLNTKNNIDSLKVEYLQKFINLCHKKKITLIFAISPQLHRSNDIYNFGKEMAKRNNIGIIDYQEMNTSFNDKMLFQDSYHLNNDGATKYTLKVIEYLNSN